MGEAKKDISNIQATEIVKSMIEQLNYPHQILPPDLSPKKVMRIYKDALKRGKKEGFVPVLVAEDELLDEYFGILRDEDHYNIEETRKMIHDNGIEILQNYYKGLTEPEDESDDEAIGEMAYGTKDDVFISVYDLDGKMKQTVLFEIPTKNPWEVVVYVPFGGWNECPVPEEMASVCKYWFEKYGAIPAVITHDTLEFFVPEPIPKDKAIEVAKEHFAFCIDRVTQCTESGTIGEVADSLWRSHVWYFWWD